MSESPLKNIWNPFDGVTEDEDGDDHEVVVNQFHLRSFLILSNLLRGLIKGHLEHNIIMNGKLLKYRYLSVNTNVQVEKCCEGNYCVHNKVGVSQVVTNVDFAHPQTRRLKNRISKFCMKRKYIFSPLVLPSSHLHNNPLFRKDIPTNRNLDPKYYFPLLAL